MTTRLKSWGLILSCALLTACGETKPTLPPLPDVDLALFSGQARAGVEAALESVKSKPEDAAANGRLGMYLHAHDLDGAAQTCYQRAQTLAPSEARWPYYIGVLASNDGNTESAETALQQSIRLRPYAPALVKLANLMRDSGRTDLSRRYYEEAVQLDRQAPAAYFGLGRLLAEQGETAEAVTLLQKAAELDPKAGAAHYALAMALRELGKANESESHLAAAERYNQAQPGIYDPLLEEVTALRADRHYYLMQGLRARESGDLPTAIRMYQAALEQDETFAEAHVNLISAYGALGDMARAEQHYRRALELDPNIEELHLNWGIAESLQGHLDEAAAAFREVIRINPTSADAHFNLGSTLAQMNRPEQAASSFRRTLELEPNHRLANFQVGRSLVESGKTTEGIRYLERAAAGAPDDRTPGILYGLADAYARLGDNVAAVEIARQALAAAEAMGQQDIAQAIRGDLAALGISEP